MYRSTATRTSSRSSCDLPSHTAIETNVSSQSGSWLQIWSAVLRETSIPGFVSAADVLHSTCVRSIPNRRCRALKIRRSRRDFLLRGKLLSSAILICSPGTAFWIMCSIRKFLVSCYIHKCERFRHFLCCGRSTRLYWGRKGAGTIR